MLYRACPTPAWRTDWAMRWNPDNRSCDGGTQLKTFRINKPGAGGPKQTPARPACPPLMFPCRFNLSTRTTNELAARKAIRGIEGRDIEDVRQYIDAKSETYN